LKRLCMPETGCSVSTRFVAEGHLERVGPCTYTRIAEIMSGRAAFQQGLATTCKDPTYKGKPRRWEGFGLTHESV